jgi:hypothetical protein
LGWRQPDFQRLRWFPRRRCIDLRRNENFEIFDGRGAYQPTTGEVGLQDFYRCYGDNMIFID